MEQRIWLAQLPLYEVLADACAVSSNSEAADTVARSPMKQGTRFRVLETVGRGDGVQHMHAVLDGETEPIGWLAVRSHQTIKPAATTLPCFQCTTLLKVREQADMSSSAITTLPEGTIVHVLETKRLMDGSQRVCVALLGEEGIFGWATSWKPATKILTIRRYEHAEMVPSRVGSSTSSMTPPLGGLSTTRSGVHRTPRSASAGVHRKQLDFHSSLLWHARRTSSSLHLAPTGQDHDQPTTSSAMVLRTPRSPRTPRTPRTRLQSKLGCNSPFELPASFGDEGRQRGRTEPHDHEIAGRKSARDIQAVDPLTLPQLQELMSRYRRQESAEAAKLDNTSVRLQLGDALAKVKNVKELVGKWAKHGAEPISKMQFRQSARNMLQNAETRDIDELFDVFDDNHDGSLDVDELKDAFKTLIHETANRAKMADSIRKQIVFFAQRAACVQEVIAALEAAEASCREADSLDKSVDARLGTLLRVRSMKATEIVSRWDPSGTGQIAMRQFRINVRGLGLEASDHEIDGLFRSLDEDGGGTLDMSEIKHALANLQEAAIDADRTAKKLEKAKVSRSKEVASTMLKVQGNLLDDNRIEAEEQQKRQREVEEEEQRIAAAREMRRRASIEKATLSAQQKADFEAKIAARRGSIKEG